MAMAKRGVHQKERDNNGGNGIRASHHGGVSKLPGKTIANYLKPTISSCHVGSCRYPRSQKQAPEPSSMATSSAKLRSSINKARLLSSVPERTPVSISPKERARTRAEKSPMIAAISTKKRTTGTEKSPVTAAIGLKERTRRTDGRSSMAAISPKRSLGKAFKTPTSGKAVPLKTPTSGKAVPLRKANVAATTSTTAAKSEDDKVIHVIDETQTQDQAKGTEVEVEEPHESKAKVESEEPKAAKTDDDEVSHETEGKMALQPESEVGGDETVAEEKEKGEEEGVAPKVPANGRNEPLPAYNAVIEEKATKLAARRNKVLALAGAFESVISLQMPEPSSQEQAAMTVRSVSRGRGRAAQSTQPQTEERNGGNEGAN